MIYYIIVALSFGAIYSMGNTIRVIEKDERYSAWLTDRFTHLIYIGLVGTAAFALGTIISGALMPFVIAEAIWKFIKRGGQKL